MSQFVTEQTHRRAAIRVNVDKNPTMFLLCVSMCFYFASHSVVFYFCFILRHNGFTTETLPHTHFPVSHERQKNCGGRKRSFHMPQGWNCVYRHLMLFHARVNSLWLFQWSTLGRESVCVCVHQIDRIANISKRTLGQWGWRCNPSTLFHVHSPQNTSELQCWATMSLQYLKYRA